MNNYTEIVWQQISDDFYGVSLYMHFYLYTIARINTVLMKELIIIFTGNGCDSNTHLSKAWNAVFRVVRS